MQFLGTTFFGGRYIIDPSPTKVNVVNSVAIKSGTFDQLFVTKDGLANVEDTHKDWDFNTVLNAEYDEGFDAGNSGFSLRNTEQIVIKVREKGTFDWISIYKKDINKLSDFKISIKDFKRASRKDYEYMICSYSGGIMNAYTTSDVRSEFNGLFICDKDNIYGSVLDTSYVDTTTETNGTAMNLLNNKYPTVVNNGISDYEAGNAGATFLRFNQDDGSIDFNGSLQYRDTVKRFLNDKKPKILKFLDGRIWLVSINGAITDSGDGNPDKRVISFDWVEIGNVNDMETLYNNNLSDLGREWWS